MKTNKRNTKEVLFGIYGRSSKGVLNHFDSDYFLHIVEVTSINDERLYNEIHSKRKALSIAKSLICEIVNIDLYFQGYEGYYCTYKQVREILSQEFNYNIEILENALSLWIEEERKELQ